MSTAVNANTLTVLGQTTLTRLSESMTTAGQSSGSIMVSWTGAGIYYVASPYSANMTLTINQLPNVVFTGTYDFSFIFASSTYKTWIQNSTISANNTSGTVTSTSMYFSGGNSSITTANYILQNFVLMYSNSATPFTCFSAVSAFY
jgi:hypothetical protein